MMWPSINPGIGWALILASAVIGTLAVLIALRNEKPKHELKVLTPVPDLRIIESDHFWAIYNGTERQKLLALLSSGDIKAWARPMATDPLRLARDSDLVQMAPNDWQLVYLDPMVREDWRPQVFLKRKSDNLSVKHDLFLSQHQFESYWPKPKPLDSGDQSIWWAFAIPSVLLFTGAVSIALPQIITATKPIDPAYGMLSIQEFKLDKIGDELKVRMFLRNASKDHTIDASPQWVSVQINGTIHPAMNIDTTPVLAPEEVRILSFPQFPISELKMSGVEQLKISFRIKYGFAGSELENVLCEIEHCSFGFTPPNLISGPSCKAEVCK